LWQYGDNILAILLIHRVEMFFFLSKFLPLFFYPLGLACLLLVITLVLFWRRPRWVPYFLGVTLIVLILGGNGWLSSALLRSLEFRHLPPNPIPQADAIVVLGGATRPHLAPRPWVEVNEAGDRPLYGAKLYKEGKAPFLLFSGGRVTWRGGVEGSEAADMTELAIAMGVPKSAIIQEDSSLNTYQNAVKIKQILQQYNLKTILLVTSATHMPRSYLIFKKLGIDAIPVPTDFVFIDNPLASEGETWEAIVLNLMPDAENLVITTRVLKEYLGMFIYFLRGWL
jgi:uncharacterized SAM-binding protein YcdF (DUF218 family)